MQPDPRILLTEVFGPTDPESTSAQHLLYEKLLEAYVLGERDGQDVTRMWPDMAPHILVCEQCRSEYHALREIIDLDRMAALPDPPLPLLLDWSFVDTSMSLGEEGDRAEAKVTGWAPNWKAMIGRWGAFNRKRQQLTASWSIAKRPSAKLGEDSLRKAVPAPRRGGMRLAWMATLIVISCLLGVYLGYVRRSPVGWANFSDLRSEDKIAFIELVALGYAQTGDLEQARQQLAALGETGDVRLTMQIAEKNLMQGDELASQDALARLRMALDPSVLAVVAVPPTTAATPWNGEAIQLQPYLTLVPATPPGSRAPDSTPDSITVSPLNEYRITLNYGPSWRITDSTMLSSTIVFGRVSQHTEELATDGLQYPIGPIITPAIDAVSPPQSSPIARVPTPTLPTYIFTLEGQGQYPNNGGMSILAYIFSFSNDLRSLRGYSLAVRRNGRLLSTHKDVSGSETLGLTIKFENSVVMYPYNLRVEYQEPPDGVWEVQLVDADGDFVGPPARFILSADDPMSGLYLRYRQR